MEQPLRVGIISANWGIAAHLPAWRAVPGVEVVGICTAHQETADAAARAHAIPYAFADYRQMAADPRIDIVDVGTRPNLRYDMCMSALAAGKHVYNGVPFADTFGHARALHDAYLHSGRVATVDAYSEYLPPIAFARQLIDDGVLGELYSLTCTLQLSLFNHQVSTFPYNWFWKREHGCSALRNLGSHALNVLYYLFGDVESVVAQNDMCLKTWRFADNGTELQPEVEDTANVLLSFKTGGTGALLVGWSAIAGRGFMIDAYGSKGRLLIEGPGMPSNDTKVYRASAGEWSMTELTVPERFQRQAGVAVSAVPGAADRGEGPRFAMALAYADMVDAIKNQRRGRPDFTQAFHTHAVIEAAERSARERRWVEISDVLQGN